MSQQYPNDPNQPQQPYQQPHPGGPGAYPQGPAPYQPPQEPKKSWVARHKVLTVIGGVFAFIVIIGIAAGGGDGSSGNTGKKPATAVAPQAPAKGKADAKPAEKKEQPKEDLSQGDQFKAFVSKNGTGAEKAAVAHVTKVQGADEHNGIADTADIYTDFAGGLVGPHQGEGKLLASAFADWKTSENGLVTVYDKDGQILSNGQF
ncbi:hypothetical protein AB0D12_31825 [Streptomyces sp. NPDC048479]|uniref:hypothetical protein n=1 Tax=Streptomyces sp. NPDC048479 TaxID=3154725 RepID=UPI003424FAFA